ncbi:MAG TPA: NAD(P)-binding domain-containing protein [Jiangellaceae bacterium]|nr:NAD(P)-binding domain-containing protein [Jiangellaceae bacterium]
MTTRVPTLIVGAGQAGLALSRCLTEFGHEHLLVDRGNIAERWRSERWDSFTLLTPNWQTRLPAFRYTGLDREGFMTREQVVEFFGDYARSFDAPVRTGVTVTGVHQAPHGWIARTDTGRIHATNVVIATGHYDRPTVPALAADLPRGVHQLHTTDYRNPEQLPSGAVLVVGAGPSGQQIADELARAGREVFIAVGRHRPLPRRYRGHDVYWWMDRMGMLDRTVDTLPEPGASRHAPSVVLAGEERDLDLRRLVEDGVVPTGRLIAAEGGSVYFDDDLPTRLAEADENVRRLRAAVDGYVEKYDIDARAEQVTPPAPPPWAHEAPRTLDLGRAGVTTAIWATGHSRDYSWIHAPVFDAEGEPVQRRGVTAAPGLYFLGLRWLHRRKSNFIDGVGDDAVHIAEVIADNAEAVGEAVA